MVTSTRDKQEIKKRILTQHCRKLSTYKRRDRQNKKEREHNGKNQKTMNKITITTYLSIITLNVNESNAPINRPMDKEVVHIYNGILLGRKK